MKKLFSVFTVTLLLTSMASAQIEHQPTVEQEEVYKTSNSSLNLERYSNVYSNECVAHVQYEDDAAQILRLLADAQKIELVGELPTGDKVFLFSGLPTFAEPEEFSEDDFHVGRINYRYTHAQVLVLKSYEFDKWKMLPLVHFNDNLFITKASITSNGKVVMDFAKKTDPSTRVLQGIYDLKTKQLIPANLKDKEILFPGRKEKVDR